MSEMNGALCKIIGKFDEKEQRYPVYVYDTKETVLIKPSNLSVIKRNIKSKVKQSSKLNVIYDMETGDPDDLFAILFLISHPDVNLRAITITPGTPLQVGAVKNVVFNKLEVPEKSILIGSANPNHRKKCEPNRGVWQRVCSPTTE